MRTKTCLLWICKKCQCLENNGAQKGDITPFFGGGRMSCALLQGLHEAERSWIKHKKSLTWKGASREKKPNFSPLFFPAYLKYLKIALLEEEKLCIKWIYREDARSPVQRMSSFHGSFLLVGMLRFVWPLLFPKMRKRSLCSSWKQGKEECKLAF